MRIAVVPGDGIGVDVTREAVKTVEAIAQLRSLPFEPVYFPWSADHYLTTGETIPPGAFDDGDDDTACVDARGCELK